MDLPVECGFPRKWQIQYFCINRQEKVLDTSVQFELGMENLCIREKKTNSMENHFFFFLKRLFRSSCRSGRKVVVIADNARYHHAVLHKKWREQKKRRFALEFLPPYSPELNPIERVWKLTRRQATHNRYFSTLQELTYSVENVFMAWSCKNNILSKLCAIV